MNEKNINFKLHDKTYKYISWVIQTAEKFPKSQRYLLASRLIDESMSVISAIIEANYNKYKRNKIIEEANISLDKIRTYLRLSKDLRYISFKQFEFASSSIEEIGRMLGGWKRSLK